LENISPDALKKKNKKIRRNGTLDVDVQPSFALKKEIIAAPLEVEISPF